MLGTGLVEPDVVGAKRVRNSSLCVDSSPGAAGLQESNGDQFRRGFRSASNTRSTALEESIMTATYTFDIFSSLDGFGSHSGGDWGGYWGKQGPRAARPPPRLVRRGAADGLRGEHVPGVRADAGLEHRGVRGA